MTLDEAAEQFAVAQSLAVTQHCPAKVVTQLPGQSAWARGLRQQHDQRHRLRARRQDARRRAPGPHRPLAACRHPKGKERPARATAGPLGCDHSYSTDAADDQISDALRVQLSLLTPEQIQQEIKRLGLLQQELAKRLGVVPETLSRWANGALIQLRAMDNLLRLYFAHPNVAEVLPAPSAPVAELTP